MARRKNSPADMPEEQDETLDLSDEIQPVPTDMQEQSIDAPDLPTEQQEIIGDPVVDTEQVVSVLDSLKDEAHYRVSFSLPLSVLVAVLDPEHSLANVEAATALHLLDGGKQTQIGELVAKSFDETAVRHKMNAAWRAAHNAGLDRKG